MQNAKDTFFVALQARLAALNPARTVVVRGVLRPGVVVEENELATAAVATDLFRLEWTGMHVDTAGPMLLVAMQCTVRYATDGSAGNGGMDRGRLLAAMDGELAAALGTAPFCAAKLNFAAAGTGVAPVAMGTNVFWAAPVLGATVIAGDRMERSATVAVYAYQEAGEL